MKSGCEFCKTIKNMVTPIDISSPIELPKHVDLGMFNCSGEYVYARKESEK